MVRVLRRNVLVDMGELTNLVGAKLIEVPEAYKRINSRGKIVHVADGCRILDKSHIGRECVIGVIRHADNRIPPRQAKEMGLNEHWHFIVPETQIHTVLEA